MLNADLSRVRPSDSYGWQSQFSVVAGPRNALGFPGFGYVGTIVASNS